MQYYLYSVSEKSENKKLQVLKIYHSRKLLQSGSDFYQQYFNAFISANIYLVGREKGGKGKGVKENVDYYDS